MPTRAKSPLQGVDWPVEPFYKIVVPFLPPGTNHSYQIIRWKTKLGTWAHTLADSEQSKEFKKNVAEYLDLNQGIVVADWDWIKVISDFDKKKNFVPLYADIHFYFKTLWLRDVDGCEKHLIDAAGRFLKSGDCPVNDRTIVKKNTEKFADATNPRCEISLSVCIERIRQC